MIRNRFIEVLVALWMFGFTGVVAADERPNILFLFCDDLGYGDLGVFYQNEREEGQPRIHTPHLDKVAGEGLQLRAHYVAAPVCAPSRATLFLGQHQGNAPIRDNQFDKALPDQPTLASVLQQAGYHTGLIGKWGLQGKKKLPNREGIEAVEAYPTKRGFDYFLGYLAHRDGHEHYPFERVHFKKHERSLNKTIPLWENGREISNELKGCYTADLFTAASKKFIIEHHEKTPDKPFFLMLSYDTPHAASQVATMKYPEGFGVKGGLQWIGEKGNMINTAGGVPDSFLHPDYRDKDWKEVSKRFASMLRRIDNSVGDLMRTLVDLGLEENTLVIFSSDNGPSRESYIKEPLKPEFFQSYGPFTGIKRDCWEGGIRPGALVKWPAKIKAGSISDSPSQMQDWMPTFCELAKTSTPALADGKSLVPKLMGEEENSSTIYVEYSVKGSTYKSPHFPIDRTKAKRFQMQAIREGNYKAIRTDIKSAADPFLVFDVTKDLAEANNIAGQAGVPSQAYWEAAVSRLHHTNESAKRPYDGVEIEGIMEDLVKPVLIVNEAKESASSDYVSRDSFHISGYLKLDEAKNVTFKLKDGVKGVVRVHGIMALDTASEEIYENDNTLHLGKGLHPFTLYLAERSERNVLILPEGVSLVSGP